MSPLDEIADLLPQVESLRHDLHAHPETAFQEFRTAERVAEALESAGIVVHRQIGTTGLVGSLTAGPYPSGPGTPSIALRADLDALALTELGDSAHASQVPGKMHACGHDGHTAMLVGAALHLARTRRFEGTVYFIFQPAEENDGGARAMLRDGLFDRFPAQAVFGLHNWPALPEGHWGVMPGPMMASSDRFEIAVEGRGGHGALPHQTVDPIVIGSALIQVIQTIVSRTVNPVDPAVVSVTQFHAGDTWNVVPDRAVLRGTARCLQPEVRNLVEASLARLCHGVALTHGAQIHLNYDRGYPPTVNSVPEAHFAAQVLRELAPAECVHTDLPPSTAAEDFADLLGICPGAYVWMGTGKGEGTPALHNPHFDFNDNLLGAGCAYWVKLTERFLAPKGG